MTSTTTDEPLPDWAASYEDVARNLGVDTNIGLTSREAQQRLAKYGPNRLPQKGEVRAWQILIRQFQDVLIGILFIAAAISLLVGETTDAIAIVAIIALNALLGFVQEWKAEQALAALRSMLAPSCEVIRDDRETTIAAEQLVPGDIVIIETGNRVPADARLIESVELKIDESALTGESLSVRKGVEPVAPGQSLAERTSMLWTGTSATNGRAKGVVVATGTDTEFGRIAELTSAVNLDQTPLQKKLDRLGKQLGIIAIGISILLFLLGWLSGQEVVHMFLTSVSLAVAVVPEGLPAVVTLTMALGIRAMVRRRALLRRLQAAEGLGSATVICTDKTGTLTQNEMTVTHIWMPAGEVNVTGVGYDPAGHFEKDGQRVAYDQRQDLKRLLNAGMHCSHASIQQDETGEWIPHGEPTETALIVAGYKAWLPVERRPNILTEFPFNSDRKRMSIVERDGNEVISYSKGAPDVLLERCSSIFDGTQQRALTDEDRQNIDKVLHHYASQGLRTLAIAEHRLQDQQLDEDVVERDLTLLGIVGMLDPPRPEVPQAVALARTAGIRIIMITGDSADTGLAIANQVGIPTQTAITGTHLNEMSDEDLLEALKGEVVFARTAPEHKLRIVSLLQANGEVAAMTGDGVNDAPALKKADVGIAMGNRGTDVAKNAADIVLTDDNFSSIVGAVEEGRRQYDNIQKFVRYLLSSNTGEIIAIAGNIVMGGGDMILLPVQILWMNLITDGITAVALGLEPAERTVMQRPPRDPNSRILDPIGMTWILSLGLYMGGVCLFLFSWYGATKGIPQTVAFTGLIVVEKANVLNFRSLTDSLFRQKATGNYWVYIAMVSMVLLQVAAVHVPLLQEALHTVPMSLQDWGIVLLLALPVLAAGETLKWLLKDKPSPHDSAAQNAAC